MEDKEWIVDIKVHRRILTFLNSARSPEELMVAPPNEILLVDERMMEPDERLHHDEIQDTHGHSVRTTLRKADVLLDRVLAKRVLKARDDYNPLHGFRHVSQLRHIAGFNHAILDKLIRLFSPRFRGKWETLYADAD